MPEDIAPGQQPRSELQGLTPEQNQAAVDAYKSTEGIRAEVADLYDKYDENNAGLNQLYSARFAINHILEDNEELYPPDRVLGPIDTPLSEQDKDSLKRSLELIEDRIGLMDYVTKQDHLEYSNKNRELYKARRNPSKLFREHEEGYKEQAIIDARNDGKEIIYAPYTDTAEVAQKKAEAELVTKSVDSLNHILAIWEQRLANGDLSPSEQSEISSTISSLRDRLSQQNDQLSRLGHEVGLQELRDAGKEDAILPPEAESPAPYRHEGKTPDEFMAEKREEQDNFLAETAAEKLRNYGDLRNALTDEQAEVFHAPLTRQIEGEGSMSLAELQSLRAALTQSQIDQFGGFLDKQIFDANYREVAAKNRNLAPGEMPEVLPEVTPTTTQFPSVLDNPQSPIGG